VRARWTPFAAPLARVVEVDAGRLQGCALCIAGDGSVGVLALDALSLYVPSPSLSPG
jgi:hypothetical protein